MANIVSITPEGSFGYRVVFDEAVDISMSGCAAPDTVWYLGKRDGTEDEMDIFLRATRALDRQKDQDNG
jgi:hypothetical protein